MAEPIAQPSVIAAGREAGGTEFRSLRNKQFSLRALGVADAGTW